VWSVDRIRDTLNVPLDHAFGYCPPPEKYSVGELIHMRPEGRWLRGRNVDRSALAVIRNHLKKANYQAFDNLLHAFKFYDKVLNITCVARADVTQRPCACVLILMLLIHCVQKNTHLQFL